MIRPPCPRRAVAAVERRRRRAAASVGMSAATLLVRCGRRRAGRGDWRSLVASAVVYGAALRPIVKRYSEESSCPSQGWSVCTDRPRHRRSGQRGSTRSGRLAARVSTTNSAYGPARRHHDAKLQRSSGSRRRRLALGVRPGSEAIAVSSPSEPRSPCCATKIWASDLRVRVARGSPRNRRSLPCQGSAEHGLSWQNALLCMSRVLVSPRRGGSYAVASDCRRRGIARRPDVAARYAVDVDRTTTSARSVVGWYSRGSVALTRRR